MRSRADTIAAPSTTAELNAAARPVAARVPTVAPDPTAAGGPTTIAEVLEAARSTLDRVTPFEAQVALESGALVVDTRCGDARRETGVIPGSVHVPLSVLFWRLDPTSPFSDSQLAQPDRRVILVCAHGYSSSLAAATLRSLGFHDATDLAGGFEAWAAAGLPVDRVAADSAGGAARSDGDC